MNAVLIKSYLDLLPKTLWYQEYHEVSAIYITMSFEYILLFSFRVYVCVYNLLSFVVGLNQLGTKNVASFVESPFHFLD